MLAPAISGKDCEVGEEPLSSKVAPVLVALFVVASMLAFGGSVRASSSEEQYMVLIEQGQESAAHDAIAQAGGRVLVMNKLGIATVSTSNANFSSAVQRSSSIAGVARAS